MRKIWLIGGIAAAYLLWKSGNYLYNATRLQFYMAKIGFQFSGINPTIVIDVMAQNPTTSNYQLYSLIGKLYFNDSEIGNISYYTPVAVVPNAQTKIAIPVRVSLLGAGAQLYAYYSGSQKLSKADLRIVGTVNVDNIPAPIDLTFSII